MATNYDKIKNLREKNNKNTVDILRLAFRYFPIQAKNLLIKVNKGDNKISKLLEELTLKTSRNYNQILDDLEELRRKNNINWIELMKLADKGNPIEYKKYQQTQQKLGKDINECK